MQEVAQVTPREDPWRIQDLVGDPSPAEVAYAMPKRLVPSWAEDALCEVWEPGIGEPTAWMLRVRYRDAAGEDVATVSGTFLAPDSFRDEILRRNEVGLWPVLGAYWIGTHLRALSGVVRSFRTRAAGEARGYQFLSEVNTSGGRATDALLDVMGSEEREIEVAGIADVMMAFIVKSIGEGWSDKMGGLARDLPLNDRFVVRMQA